MDRRAFAMGIVAVALLVAGTAAAAGPTAPVVQGWTGVVSANGTLRYVTLPAGRETAVEAVRTKDGRVERWASLGGRWGVPLVAGDGSTGGLTPSGRTLVLASAVPASVSGRTSFAVMDTAIFEPMRITLRGDWGFDAISPDAETLYLIQHTSTADVAHYRVRAYDLLGLRLLPGAIVDRREPNEAMTGYAITRATSADGRWAYTLYTRTHDVPFIHALDTERRRAFCIDLPLKVSRARLANARLALSDDDRRLTLRAPTGRRLAVVDTHTLRVERTGT
jgi:hypothetical protein